MKKFLPTFLCLILVAALGLSLAGCTKTGTEENIVKENYEENGFLYSVIDVIDKTTEQTIETYAKVTGCNLTDKILTVPSNLTDGTKITVVGGLAFYKSTANTVILSEGIKIIEGFAFGYSELISVDLPSTVTQIDDYAFVNCISLTTVNLAAATPPSVGKYSFKFFNEKSKADDQYEVMSRFHIYVNDADAYKASWSEYASVIEHKALI